MEQNFLNILDWILKQLKLEQKKDMAYPKKFYQIKTFCEYGKSFKIGYKNQEINQKISD